MFSFSKRIGYVLGAALAVAAFALPVSAANAAGTSPHSGYVTLARVGPAVIAPDSATNCDPTGYPERLAQECTAVVGGGLKVDSISGRALNTSTPLTKST